jgi:hypothetical protein
MKNPFSKTRPPENPYEIWGNSPLLPNWEWHVLKKWQADDNKKYARWFCNVKTPIVPRGEMGDVYVNDIIKDAGAVRVCKGCRATLREPDVHNALSRYDHGSICSACGTQEALSGDFITDNGLI